MQLPIAPIQLPNADAARQIRKYGPATDPRQRAVAVAHFAGATADCAVAAAHWGDAATECAVAVAHFVSATAEDTDAVDHWGDAAARVILSGAMQLPSGPSQLPSVGAIAEGADAAARWGKCGC